MEMNFFKAHTIAPDGGGGGASLSFHTASLQGIGARKEQQDSFKILDISGIPPDNAQGVLAMVADGMGGLREGSKYSAAAIDCIEGFRSHYQKSGGDTSVLLMHLLVEANDRIGKFSDSNDTPMSVSGGTTFLAAAIFANRLSFISVGDSRISLMRNGALLQLNREHAYSVQLDDNAIRGEISFETAAMDSQRRALTSYLGMKRLALIDRNVNPIRLLPKDFILLMTDGVFNTLTESEIVRAVSARAEKSAKRLKKAVLDKSSPNQDNFTAIIIECI